MKPRMRTWSKVVYWFLGIIYGKQIGKILKDLSQDEEGAR
jgi:hypothetical protein